MDQYPKWINRLRNAWADLILERMPDPTQFITLTYDEPVTAFAAESDVRRLTQRLDEAIAEATGRRRRKHRFFQYVMVFDGDVEAVTCVHLLVDEYVDLKVIRRYWKHHWHVEEVDEPIGLVHYMASHINLALEPVVYFHKKSDPMTPPLMEYDYGLAGEA